MKTTPELCILMCYLIKTFNLSGFSRNISTIEASSSKLNYGSSLIFNFNFFFFQKTEKLKKIFLYKIFILYFIWNCFDIIILSLDTAIYTFTKRRSESYQMCLYLRFSYLSSITIDDDI